LTELLYTPHSYQKAMHASTAKNKVMEVARRGGKSRSAFWELIDAWQEAQQKPVARSLVPPFNAWVVGPTDDQLGQAWDEANDFIPQAWVMNARVDEMEIYLKGVPGRPWGKVSFKSAFNPNALQTQGLDFLWVTESQDISEQAYLRLLPMLTESGRMGRAVWEGIPALFKDHWFWRLCDLSQSGTNENYAYFHWTAYQNPMLSQQMLEEIETHRELMTDTAWRRMYLAERSESAGFFKNLDRCTAGDLLIQPIPGATYAMGVDLGRRRDATVVWVLDTSKREGAYHARWTSESDWGAIRTEVGEIAQRFGVRSVKIDSTGMGGDMFYQDMLAANIPVEEYTLNESSRRDLLNNLAVAMERETVHFAPVPELLREMRAFQYVKHGNSYRPDHPDGEHDDEIFALALGLLACDPPSEVSTTAFRTSPIRYLPTQDEVNGGILRSRAGHNRHAAALERMRERWQKAGVEL
jgi:hypothetical protein